MPLLEAAADGGRAEMAEVAEVKALWHASGSGVSGAESAATAQVELLSSA